MKLHILLVKAFLKYLRGDKCWCKSQRFNTVSVYLHKSITIGRNKSYSCRNVWIYIIRLLKSSSWLHYKIKCRYKTGKFGLFWLEQPSSDTWVEGEKSLKENEIITVQGNYLLPSPFFLLSLHTTPALFLFVAASFVSTFTRSFVPLSVAHPWLTVGMHVKDVVLLVSQR